MKEMKSMLVVNWHYFSHSLISFKTLNFLTGQNAAGKSTLIDAIQVVMLGETKSHIFNKAANDKSERTLIGYLKGELGDDGKTGFRYLREGDFNSFIVLEFYDTVKRKPFIAGVIFDAYSDGTQKHNFFLADCSIPEHHFLKDDVPYNRDELKKYLQKKTGNRLGWFDTQTTYRNNLRGKCGNIKPKFFSLFKKAIPFSPISDVENFITEFVTDIKGRPDIEEMQENLRSYKRLEKEAESIKDRIVKLESVEKIYNVMQIKRRQKLMHEVISAYGELNVKTDKLDNLLKTIDATKERLKHNEQISKQLKDKKENWERDKNKLITEKAESDLQKKLNSINEEENRIENEINKLSNELNDTLHHLISLADKLLNLNESFLTESELVLLQKVKELSVETLNELSNDVLEDFDEILQRWSLYHEDLRYKVDSSLIEERNDLIKMKNRLERLKKGNKDYPEDVSRLANHLKSNGIKGVFILADLLDLKDYKWQAAIEGYLHRQKFYLLVEKTDYLRAVEIYNELRNSYPVYGTGLIDVEKLELKQPILLEGSLSSYLTTEHPGAQLYINYVLGKVMCCEHLGDLRNHNISITENGLLYQNYVVRLLHPSRWEIPYIGKHAIEQQIKKLELEGKVKTDSICDAEILLERTRTKCEIKAFTSYEKTMNESRLNSINRINNLRDRIIKIKEEKEGLDLTYLSKLDQRISLLYKFLDENDEEIEKLRQDIGVLINQIDYLEEKDIPAVKKEITVQKAIIAIYLYNEIRDEAEDRFNSLIKTQTATEISVNYARSAKAAETEQQREYKELKNLREEYNRIYLMSHNVSAEDNGVYDIALNKLRETKLPEYLTKITEAKERATVQFRDEFLSKLKANFDSVFAQIKELNAAIKNSPFGTDKYKFEVRNKPEMRHFYDMITDELLMGSGVNISSHAFNQKHGEAIEELFRMIITIEDNSISSEKSSINKQIYYYTDYRSYLNFDLVVTDQNGAEQRLSKTLLKKSGGETQTPFYLSVLASFAHMYRINQKVQGSETIRLIVFDEAFSKMDQQRIEESLKLLRRFRLQAIISAPPDKIMDIAPHVDQNICVFRTKNVSFVQIYEQKDLKELIE